MLQRLRQYIIDSYNGIYKIVVEPYMPTRRTVFGIIFGVLIGLIWAYGIFPTAFYNAQPSQLSSSYRELWVTLVAAAAERGYYDESGINNLLQDVENPGQTVSNAINSATPGSVAQQGLTSLQPSASAAGAGSPAPPPPDGLVSDLLAWLIPVVLVLVVTPIVVVVWRLLIYPNIVAKIIESIKLMRNPEMREQRKREQAEIEIQKQMREASKEMVAATDEELGEPITQRLSIYTKGRQYDDSFEIENADNVFFGECGAAIAKTIGDNELAAIEVWLFDKEDFVRTLTKIFLSEHAYNDPAIRAELEPKVENPATDMVMVAPGAILSMETQTLRLRATVKSFTYGTTGGLPANSHFESMQIEIATWLKAGGGPSAESPAAIPAMPVPTPAAIPATPTMPPSGSSDTIQPLAPPPLQMPSEQPTTPSSGGLDPLEPPPLQQPPPQQPTTPSSGGLTPLTPQPLTPPPLQMPPEQPTTPSSGGLTPLTPPPLQQPPPAQLPDEPEDDDPFGGTGDFTPLHTD